MFWISWLGKNQIELCLSYAAPHLCLAMSRNGHDKKARA
jgi:hypothetical protein